MVRKYLVSTALFLACLTASVAAQSEGPGLLGFTGFRSEQGGVRGVFGLGMKLTGPLYSLARFDIGGNGEAFGELGYRIKPLGFLKHLTFMPLAGGGVIIEGDADPVWFMGTCVGIVAAFDVADFTAVWAAARNAVPIDQDHKQPMSFALGVSFGI